MWTSVEDKLPNDLDRVDVLINGVRRVVDVEYEAKDGSWHAFSSKPVGWKEIKNKVTHWMLVPELPKGGVLVVVKED